MSEKHSPGPWRWNTVGGEDLLFAADDELVVTGAVVCVADARLIAAAPELLAMVESLIVAAFGGMGETDETLDRKARALVRRIKEGA